jgi:hypothetical protein
LSVFGQQRPGAHGDGKANVGRPNAGAAANSVMDVATATGSSALPYAAGGGKKNIDTICF